MNKFLNIQLRRQISISFDNLGNKLMKLLGNFLGKLDKLLDSFFGLEDKVSWWMCKLGSIRLGQLALVDQ